MAGEEHGGAVERRDDEMRVLMDRVGRSGGGWSSWSSALGLRGFCAASKRWAYCRWLGQSNSARWEWVILSRRGGRMPGVRWVR